MSNRLGERSCRPNARSVCRARPAIAAASGPFAAHVADDEPPRVLVDLEHVVEVAADFVALARGLVPRGDARAGNVGQRRRQQARLQRPRDVVAFGVETSVVDARAPARRANSSASARSASPNRRPDPDDTSVSAPSTRPRAWSGTHMYDVKSSSLTICEVAFVAGRGAQEVVGHRRRRPRAARRAARSRPDARRTDRAGSRVSSSATSASLAGIGVHGGQPAHPVLFGDVDQAEVGEERNAEPAEPFEALGIVERRARAPRSSRRRTAAPPRRAGALRSRPPPARKSRAMSSTMPAWAAMSASSCSSVAEKRSASVCATSIAPDDVAGARPHGRHDAAPQRRLERRHDRVERVAVLARRPRVVEADRRRGRERRREQRRVGRNRDAERRLAQPARGRAHEQALVGFFGVEREERGHRRAGQLARRAGDRLHHLVGVELGHERRADVAQDLRDREDPAQLVVRQALRGHVEREADDARRRRRRRRRPASRPRAGQRSCRRRG